MSTQTLATDAVRGIPPTRRWLTQTEAAEHLDVTDRTIRNLIARGELRGYRVGRTRMIRIDLNELEALLRPIPAAKAG